MRRVLILAVAAGVALAGCSSPTYPELRLQASQHVPGTLGTVLEPPGDADPALSADEAAARAPLPADAEVEMALAGVVDPYEGVRLGPAWIAVARGVCIREDKGELVSDARGNDPNDLGCTRATFLLVALDTTTGDTLLATTGYDASLSWAPDVAG
jgi:hypothetical protein